MNYRKANNLCYYCGDKFDHVHAVVCLQRPKVQVNALVVNDLDTPLSEELVAQLELEDSLTNDFGHLSLNALAGTDDGHAIKLRALVKNKVMLALVDSVAPTVLSVTNFCSRWALTPLPLLQPKSNWPMDRS